MNEPNHSIYAADVLYACPTCGRPVDPDETDALEAVEVREGGRDFTTVYFHDDCFPYASRRYELV